MPILTGIVISSLENNLQASGNSLMLFIGTFFGYLPAPYVYGALLDLMKDGGKISMFFNMGYSILAVIFLYFCTSLKFRLEKKKEKQKLKNEKVKEEIKKKELLEKRNSVLKAEIENKERMIKPSKFKFSHSSDSSEESEESDDSEEGEDSEESKSS